MTDATDSSSTNADSVETHAFQAEVTQLLHLVVHSLYSHKEIFLRELISNASDALDRLRFRAITEPALTAGDTELAIRVIPDAANHTLTIQDNGIGMTHAELVRNLGTIAHSGSRAFLEQIASEGKKDLNLIGQFGVGFYSAFLVADRVEVVSRAAGESDAFRWVSDARERFTVEKATRALRGTDVILHLREDQAEYAEPWKLRELIARYSDYVSHPILLREPPGKDESERWDTVNRAAALWQRPKSEITDAQYDEFYQHLTHDTEPPLARTHFKVEGSQEFAGLLFVPKHRPLDLDLTHERRGIRLFVKRVFIMDRADELLPQWLRFVRGVIDSDDLPLNVSRELLQDSSIVRGIRKQIVKRTLDLLESVARDRPDDYRGFWEAFGAVLKEGLALEFEHRDQVAALSRFATTRSEEPISLATYVERMPAGQDAIYYVVGESRRALEHSPYLEALEARGYEVLLMTDPVDAWAAESLRAFQGKKLVSAMRADLPIDMSDEAKRMQEVKASELAPLLERVRAVLGERVREVRLSSRLTGSPCCLVVPEGGPTAFVERLLRESGREVPASKRIFELNPTHPVITGMQALLARDAGNAKIAEWIEVLYDQALITEGSHLDDPIRFAQRVSELLTEVLAPRA